MKKYIISKFVVVVAAAAVVVVGFPCFNLSAFRNSLQRDLFSTNRVLQCKDKGFAVNHTINPFKRGVAGTGGGVYAAAPGGKMNTLH